MWANPDDTGVCSGHGQQNVTLLKMHRIWDPRFTKGHATHGGALPPPPPFPWGPDFSLSLTLCAHSCCVSKQQPDHLLKRSTWWRLCPVENPSVSSTCWAGESHTPFLVSKLRPAGASFSPCAFPAFHIPPSSSLLPTCSFYKVHVGTKDAWVSLKVFQFPCLWTGSCNSPYLLSCHEAQDNFQESADGSRKGRYYWWHSYKSSGPSSTLLWDPKPMPCPAGLRY